MGLREMLSRPRRDPRGTVENPIGIPMMVNPGNHPNPHVLYGQDDIVPYPVSYRRFFNWAGMQMDTGVPRIAMHKLNTPAAGYAFGQIPRTPGLMRIQAQNPADMMPRGNSPQQWDYHVAQQTAVQQSITTGGPGMYLGTSSFRNPGSGA